MTKHKYRKFTYILSYSVILSICMSHCIMFDNRRNYKTEGFEIRVPMHNP